MRAHIPARRRTVAVKLERLITPKWTVAKLARLCDVSESAVYNWIYDLADPSQRAQAILKKHLGLVWPMKRRA